MNPAESSQNQLLQKQALYHFAALLTAISTWAGINSWAIISGLPAASFLGAIVAIAAGIVIAHILHEWGHFAGAVLSKARYTIKEAASPLFFDFDYMENNARQYLWMSAGGPLMNILLIFLALIWLPIITTPECFLFATFVGQLIYVLALEAPVSIGILKGNNPLEVLSNHFGQGRPLFVRATVAGVISGLVVVALL
jgi:hypothetical protein